jgi:carboxypeptidase family protein
MVFLSSLVLATLMVQATASAPATGSVAGRVTVDGSNTPVAGARVMLIPFGPPTRPIVVPVGPPPQATTDADGRFVFDRIRPGTYHVDVQKAGFAPLNDPRLRNEPPLAVEAGQTATLDLRLAKGAVITGRIVDAAGEPMADVRVMAMRPPPSNVRSAAPRLIPGPGAGASTNDIGEFRLSGLAAGDYYIVAAPGAGSPFGGPGVPPRAGSAKTTIAPTFYPGTADQASAHPVTVAAGAEVGNISFAMQSVAAFRVSGVIVDGNGEPIAGARVMMMANPRTVPLLLGAAGSAESQANGSFTIGEVVAGTYRLTASVPVRFSSGDAAPRTQAGAGGGGFIGGYVTGGGTSLRFDGNEPPTEVTVVDADVSGVRVVVQRRQP